MCQQILATFSCGHTCRDYHRCDQLPGQWCKMFMDMDEFKIEQPLPMECMDCVEDKKEHTTRKRLRKMSFGVISEEPRYLNDPRTDPNYKGPYLELYHPEYRKRRFSGIAEESQQSVSDISRESIPNF